MVAAQKVVITAGASGIGLTLARRFLARGDQVALCDTDPEALAQVCQDFPEVLAVQADVTDEASIGAFLAEVEALWGRVDVVCSNAGSSGPAGPIEDLAFDDWQACIEVNLHGAFLNCRWAARIMKAQGAGLILLTSSTSGLFGCPLRAPYVAAKWGLIGLTKTLAMELGPSGVRVNAICPGAVEGPRMDRVLAIEAAASGKTPQQVREQYAGGVSLRSFVTADDIADTVLFLASPVAARITGQAMTIDGHTESMV